MEEDSKLSLGRKTYLFLKGFSLIFLTLLANSVANAQFSDDPTIKSLVAEAQSKQRESSSKLRGYTYILKRSEQQLNGRGEIKKEKVKVFKVFLVARGVPIRVLLSENGKDLSPAQLAKEKLRANKEWKERKKEFEKDAGQAEMQGLFSFQGSEFTMLRTERYNNRDITVLRFKPHPGLKPGQRSNKLASMLEGELWIDVSEKAFVKLDAKLAESYKAGLLGFLLPLKPGTSLLIENSPISTGIWAPARMEFTPVLNVSPFPGVVINKQKEEMSNYEPFNKDAGDLFKN